MPCLRRILAVLMLIFLLGPAIPYHVAHAEMADSAISISVLGQCGGGAESLALRDNVLYAGIGPRLVIYDVTNASAPQELGKSEVLPGLVNSVDLSGSYAFLAIHRVGLRILDISDPTLPALVGAYDSLGDASAVAVSGSRAFLADGSAGLVLLDVSTPATPQLLDSLDTSGDARRVAMHGDYAYVADQGGGLQTVAIADGGTMTLARTVDTVGGAHDVAIQESMAYVAAMYQGGLRVYSLADPADPVETAALTALPYPYMRQSPRDIVLVGDRAYLTGDGSSGSGSANLWTVDISSPDNPQTIALRPVVGYMTDVAVSGSHVFVSSIERGVHIYDIGDAELPEVSQIPGSRIGGLVVRDSVIYALGGGQLFTIDATDPTQPQLVNSLGIGGWSSHIVAAGDYLYAANGYGLRVIDVTDPFSATIVGSYNTLDFSNHVVISDAVAYVADGASGLLAIDVSDPTNPNLLGQHNTPGQAYRVALDGSLAYVADWDSLQIIDISSPSEPSPVGVVEDMSMAVSVVLVAPYAYVATLYDGLYVVDITEPEVPTVSSILDMGDGMVGGLTRSGDLLYVSTSTGSGAIVDVSEPAMPVVLATYTTPSGGGGQLVGNLLYASGRGGLAIMHTNLPSSAETTADGGTLAHYGSEGQETTVCLPVNAVTETTTLVYTPQDAPGAPPIGYTFAGRAFSLEAYRDGALLSGFTFEQPVTVTLEYTDAEVEGLDESTLVLHTWDGSSWVDAASSCSPASTYVREVEENRLSVGICHLSEFAVFGQPERVPQGHFALALPLVKR